LKGTRENDKTMRMIARKKNDQVHTNKAANVLVDEYITTISFFSVLTKYTPLLTFHELISPLNADAA